MSKIHPRWNIKAQLPLNHGEGNLLAHWIDLRAYYSNGVNVWSCDGSGKWSNMGEHHRFIDNFKNYRGELV